MTRELSGKPIAIALNKLAQQLIDDHNISPMMLLIQAGADPASSYYVQSIAKQEQNWDVKLDFRLFQNPSQKRN
jgi:5,10-methylene-tetrahydrofolate dehydrogenase/methenyl tetrahydrofolate cyclohydrolase